MILHLFNVVKSERDLQEWIAGGSGINDWEGREEGVT